MQPYVIRQGDYLSRLAVRFGFDADEVWNHADNRDLRERRESYDVLAPGDIIYLPTRAAGLQPLSPQTTNRFRGRPATVPVSVRLVVDGEPVRSKAVRIEGVTPAIDAQTDGDGVLRFDAPMNVDRVVAQVVDDAFSFALMIGHLDPISEDSGVAGRLANLGYLPPNHAGLPEAARLALIADAVAAFQSDQGTEATGELDEDTRRALGDRHGS